LIWWMVLWMVDDSLRRRIEVTEMVSVLLAVELVNEEPELFLLP